MAKGKKKKPPRVIEIHETCRKPFVKRKGSEKQCPHCYPPRKK